MEKGVMRRQIFIHISDLLAERGLLGNGERNVMKGIIDHEEMQEALPLWKGDKNGKSGNL